MPSKAQRLGVLWRVRDAGLAVSAAFFLCALPACESIIGSSTTIDPVRLGAATVYRDELVVAGGIDVEDRDLVSSVMTSIVRWNGHSWSRLGKGFVKEYLGGSRYLGIGDWEYSSSDLFLSVIEFDDDLVVSGTFTGVDGRDADRFATWNGQSWSPMPPAPFESPALALFAHDGTLIAGGISDERQCLAVWEEGAWADSPLGGGLALKRQ